MSAPEVHKKKYTKPSSLAGKTASTAAPSSIGANDGDGVSELPDLDPFVFESKHAIIQLLPDDVQRQLIIEFDVTKKAAEPIDTMNRLIRFIEEQFLVSYLKPDESSLSVKMWVFTKNVERAVACSLQAYRKLDTTRYAVDFTRDLGDVQLAGHIYHSLYNHAVQNISGTVGEELLYSPSDKRSYERRDFKALPEVHLDISWIIAENQIEEAGEFDFNALMPLIRSIHCDDSCNEVVTRLFAIRNFDTPVDVHKLLNVVHVVLTKMTITAIMRTTKLLELLIKDQKLSGPFLLQTILPSLIVDKCMDADTGAAFSVVASEFLHTLLASLPESELPKGIETCIFLLRKIRVMIESSIASNMRPMKALKTLVNELFDKLVQVKGGVERIEEHPNEEALSTEGTEDV